MPREEGSVKSAISEFVDKVRPSGVQTDDTDDTMQPADKVHTSDDNNGRWLPPNSTAKILAASFRPTTLTPKSQCDPQPGFEKLERSSLCDGRKGPGIGSQA